MKVKGECHVWDFELRDNWFRLVLYFHKGKRIFTRRFTTFNQFMRELSRLRNLEIMPPEAVQELFDEFVHECLWYVMPDGGNDETYRETH